MSTFIQGNGSKLVHISDDGKKSRCGRKLDNEMPYSINWESQNSSILQMCPRCGSVDDYQTVSAEIAQRQKEERELHQRHVEVMKQKSAERLAARARLEDAIMEAFGGEDGQINFDGFTFRVSVNTTFC